VVVATVVVAVVEVDVLESVEVAVDDGVDDAPASNELNVAMTAICAEPLAATVQMLSAPEHAPDHPPKTDAVSGIARSVIGFVAEKFQEHVIPQSMPGGVLVTTPRPSPWSVTTTA
jgi:hypothetical protein